MSTPSTRNPRRGLMAALAAATIVVPCALVVTFVMLVLAIHHGDALDVVAAATGTLVACLGQYRLMLGMVHRSAEEIVNGTVLAVLGVAVTFAPVWVPRIHVFGSAMIDSLTAVS